MVVAVTGGTTDLCTMDVFVGNKNRSGWIIELDGVPAKFFHKKLPF